MNSFQTLQEHLLGQYLRKVWLSEKSDHQQPIYRQKTSVWLMHTFVWWNKKDRIFFYLKNNTAPKSNIWKKKLGSGTLMTYITCIDWTYIWLEQLCFSDLWLRGVAHRSRLPRLALALLCIFLLMEFNMAAILNSRFPGAAIKNVCFSFQ